MNSAISGAETSKTIWGVSDSRTKTTLDTHPLIGGVLVVGYDDGALEWREAESSSPRQLGATDGSKVEIVRWAPVPTLIVGCAFGDRACVFVKQGSAWRSHTLRGHGSDVLSLSWSADGSKLATCSVDNKIIIWDYIQSKQIQIITASSWVTSCSIDPAFRYVAGCVEDQVIVWRISDATEQFRSQVARKVGSKARTVDWSPDGKYLCCGGSEGSVLLVDRQNSSSISLEGFGSEPIIRVRFAPLMFKQSDALCALLCVCSKSSLVVFSSRNAVALDSTQVRECEDIAWASHERIVYCSGTSAVASHQIPLPHDYEVLTFAETRAIVTQAYHEGATLISLDANESFTESVSQMEQEARAKHVESTMTRKEMPPPPPPPPPPSTAAQVNQQRETITKTGKKRIQPINANTVSEPPPPPPKEVIKSNGHTATTDTSAELNGVQPDEDCGKCKHCLDKPKFGGKNVLKQRCQNRLPAPKRSRASLPQEKVTAEEEEGKSEGGSEDDGWSSSEIEPDSDNDANTAVVLVPLRFPGLTDSSTQFVGIAGGRQLTVSVDAIGRRQRLTLTCSTGNERLWVHRSNGTLTGLVTSGRFVCLTTSADELHILHTPSGASLISTIALECASAFLRLVNDSKLAFCTRDGYLSIMDLDLMQITLSRVLLSPLVRMRGKPFVLGETTAEGSRHCSIHLTSNGTPVLLLASRGEMSCVGFAYSKTWMKILDPLRFLGSEFCQLRPLRASEVSGDVAMLQNKLLLGLAVLIPSSHLTALIAQNAPSMQMTVLHVESLVFAAQAVESKAEERKWLEALFDLFAKDYDAFHRKAHQWLRVLDTRFDSSYVDEAMLTRLAKNRKYQSMMEARVERKKSLAAN